MGISQTYFASLLDWQTLFLAKRPALIHQMFLSALFIYFLAKICIFITFYRKNEGHLPVYSGLNNGSYCCILTVTSRENIPQFQPTQYYM